MTIVAGFPGAGFVVLSADSEEGGGIAKSSVHKIALVDKGTCKCLIGGAGHGDFIDLAVQHADEQFPATSDIKTMRHKLEAIVTDIYTKRIESYPEYQRSDMEFELLCAMWSKKDGAPKLVRVRRSAHLVKKGPEVIGIGTYLARYLIATLGAPELDLGQSLRLATYIIAQAKKHVAQCGGSSQVMALTLDGTVLDLPTLLVTQHEMMASLILEDIAKVVFYATDPVATKMNFDVMRIALEEGIAAWGAQLPARLLSMYGLWPDLIAQMNATTPTTQDAVATEVAESSNPTTSSSDQT